MNTQHSIQISNEESLKDIQFVDCDIETRLIKDRAFRNIVITGLIIICALGIALAAMRPAKDMPTQLVYTAPGGNAVNRFTLRLNAGVLELLDDKTGAVLCSQKLLAISSVIVNGADGDADDTLTLDFGGGMFSVPGAYALTVAPEVLTRWRCAEAQLRTSATT
jgi:hypothetical protein